MTVLVCVPYFRTPDYVERCVRSVLAQTHRDLVCVVVGDGEVPPLPPIADDRLVVYSYPVNRGVYFAQDVAIWASPFEWYAPVGSDDWLGPDHIERLVAYRQDMACGALVYHNDRRPKGRVVRKAYEVGMYRTSRYTEIGAHNPAERLGQDSLTLAVMRIVGPVGATDVPTYHRLGRPGSLSTHPSTKKGSPAREGMRRRNRRIVARCRTLRRPARIRAYRESLVPADLRAELAERVGGLGGYLR